MSVTLALDTCVVSDADFMKWAKSEPGIDLVIPSVVYMERRRQLLNNRKDPETLERLLMSAHIEVTQFDKNCARLASEYMNRQPRVCECCHKLDWVDMMILASIERPQAMLVTRNIGDFESYGLDDRVITPEEAIERFGQWSNPIRCPY